MGCQKLISNHQISTSKLSVVWRKKGDEFLYPFGMLMPERQSSSESYSYGFNGMEKDDEAKGAGNSYTTEFRQYDPRLIRWLSLDPLMAKYPWQSPYAAFNNNPIYYADPSGAEGEEGGKIEGSQGNVLNEVSVTTEGYKRPMSKKATQINFDPDEKGLPSPKPVPITKSGPLDNLSVDQMNTIASKTLQAFSKIAYFTGYYGYANKTKYNSSEDDLLPKSAQIDFGGIVPFESGIWGDNDYTFSGQFTLGGKVHNLQYRFINLGDDIDKKVVNVDFPNFDEDNGRRQMGYNQVGVFIGLATKSNTIILVIAEKDVIQLLEKVYNYNYVAGNLQAVIDYDPKNYDQWKSYLFDMFNIDDAKETGFTDETINK